MRFSKWYPIQDRVHPYRSSCLSFDLLGNPKLHVGSCHRPPRHGRPFFEIRHSNLVAAFLFVGLDVSTNRLMCPFLVRALISVKLECRRKGSLPTASVDNFYFHDVWFVGKWKSICTETRTSQLCLVQWFSKQTIPRTVLVQDLHRQLFKENHSFCFSWTFWTHI